MTFGEKVKSLRLRDKISQKELASKLNFSKANMSKYESGDIEPSILTIRLISKFFDVTTD